MKIVHITTVHDPFDNRIFCKECQSLARMGHKVVLVAVHENDQMVRGIQIRALPKPRNRLGRMLGTNFRAYRKARDEEADIYHFHDPEFIPLALLLKIRGNKSIVYDVHEDYSSQIRIKGYLPPLLRNVLASFFSFFERLFTKGFSKVLAEKYYRDTFKDGVTILNYPLSDLLHLPLNEPPDERIRLIYTGNITSDRGAFEHAAIVNYLDQALVYLTGKCDQKLAEKLYEVADQNRDRLFINGIDRFIPFEEIKECYSGGRWTAGLALFPPNAHYIKKELTKFFEYMGAGIPVVCSDFPVWRNLIEETGAGLCVNPVDQGAIKAALEYLFSNRDEAITMGQKGRSGVENTYRWNNEALKLEKLYLDLVREIN